MGWRWGQDGLQAVFINRSLHTPKAHCLHPFILSTSAVGAHASASFSPRRLTCTSSVPNQRHQQQELHQRNRSFWIFLQFLLLSLDRSSPAATISPPAAMYNSSYSRAKFAPDTRESLHRSRGKSCGYYMRIVFFFSSLIQSLIIVSLVLFLIYGQPEKSAEEKRVEVSGLSIDTCNA